MCYHWIITGRSLVWFLLSIITTMLIASALVLPSWLMGAPAQVKNPINNFTLIRSPSVGIYTRCIVSHTSGGGFHCGSFDLDGLATDSSIYPTEWKAAMIFLSLALMLAGFTVSFSLMSCCRQSLFGKSIHAVTGSGQALVGVLVLMAVFLHPLGWGADRVKRLCGPDAEPFSPADCNIGLAMMSAIAAVLLSFCCAFLSLKAEASNLRSRVRRRVEHGEKLVCLP